MRSTQAEKLFDLFVVIDEILDSSPYYDDDIGDTVCIFCGEIDESPHDSECVMTKLKDRKNAFFPKKFRRN